MKYTANVTVQLVLKKSKMEVQVTPTEEYRVKHQDKSYTIFVAGKDSSVSSRIFEKEADFEFSDSLKEILIQASFARTCVTVIIGNKGKKIIGITIPANP